MGVINRIWLSFGLALCLTLAYRVQSVDQIRNDFYEAADAKLKEDAINCTRYIPEDWQKLMREHKPPLYKSGRLLYVPEEYLFDCLKAEFKNKNRTSPFSFSKDDNIEYSIVLNEVMSLSFDGLLVTQASNICYICNLDLLIFHI